jgi:hypothetical protein
MASKEELESQNSKNNDQIRDELKEALQQSRSLQEQMNQLREKNDTGEKNQLAG